MPDLLSNRLVGRFPAHDVPFSDPGDRGHGTERTLALVLAYEGSPFAGWQVQRKGRTVQGELEKTLGRLCDHPVRVQASGRTDAGVHALGQVAHFKTTSGLALERMARGLAALTPPEIHIRQLGPVAPEFHARFAAKAKTYEYYLWPGAKAPLFLLNRAWCLKRPLDEDRVRKALGLCVGEVDMAALASQGGETAGSTKRNILAARLETDQGGLWRISLTATGFLRHAVRNLVGILSQIGSGRMEPEELAGMLAVGQRLRPGPKAPPGGLYLAKVYYRETPSPESLS